MEGKINAIHIPQGNTIEDRVSPLNNLLITPSPCKDCKHEEEIKDICSPICERIKAYRAGKDWIKFPIPEKLPRITREERKPKPECIIKGCTRESDSRGLCNPISKIGIRGKSNILNLVNSLKLSEAHEGLIGKGLRKYKGDI